MLKPGLQYLKVPKMEQTSEVMTCRQFSAIWKHVDKNSFSMEVQAGRGFIGSQQRRCFLNLMLVTLGLLDTH